MELWVPVSCCHVPEWILGAVDGLLPCKLSGSHCRACFPSLPQFCMCVCFIWWRFCLLACFLECSAIFFSVCRAAWKCWGKFFCGNPKPKGISCSPEKQFRGAPTSAPGVCSTSALRPRRGEPSSTRTVPLLSHYSTSGDFLPNRPHALKPQVQL